MLIRGRFFHKDSAAQLDANLKLVNDTYRLLVSDGTSFEGVTSTIQVSDRLGNVERKLTFDEIGVFATSDNDAIDRHLGAQKPSSTLLHAIESRLVFVAIALVVTVTTTLSFFKWGVPWIGHTVAHALPVETNELIAQHTLEFFDEYIFDTTEVDADRASEIRQHFVQSLLPLDESNKDINYTIHFRKWGDDDFQVPNALALPSGDIILTDKFVELVEDQDEMDSVLLHEMGHIVHRHSLEMLVEATLLTVFVTLIVGDVSGIADLGVGLGSLLITSKYIRDHETEADTYAFEKMLKAGIDPEAFSRIMNRMEAYVSGRSKECDGDDCDSQSDTEVDVVDKSSQPKKNTLDYFSTHPSTADRVRRAQQYSACFKNKLVQCEI